MFSYLKSHPFAVETFFESSLVLAYAVPREQLEKLIPPCLELDTFDEKWGFVAAAMVNTKRLRPKGFPAWMGSDFFLAGYRVFVRYTTPQGKSWRGLYILKSETDSARMTFFGNIFTHYHYTTTDIKVARTATSIQIQSSRSQLDIAVDLGEDDSVPLPTGSPFADWKQARRFAGPLPFTFTFDAPSREVLIIEGVRQHWTPRPVQVTRAQIGFVEKLGFSGAVLANAFVVEDIPYYWKKGVINKWNG